MGLKWGLTEYRERAIYLFNNELGPIFLTINE